MVPVNIDPTASITAKGADMKRSHTSVQNICAGLSWWPLSTGFKSGVRATGTEKEEDVEEVLRDEEEKQSLKLHHRVQS